MAQPATERFGPGVQTNVFEVAKMSARKNAASFLNQAKRAGFAESRLVRRGDGTKRRLWKIAAPGQPAVFGCEEPAGLRVIPEEEWEYATELTA